MSLPPSAARTAEERREAIEELLEDGVVLTPHLARLVFLYLTGAVTAGRRQTSLELTEPEAAVLHALASGLAARDLAERLGLSRAGVRGYLRGVLDKLHDRSGPGGPGLHGAGVPRRPSPGFLIARAGAMLEDGSPG